MFDEDFDTIASLDVDLKFRSMHTDTRTPIFRLYVLVDLINVKKVMKNIVRNFYFHLIPKLRRIFVRVEV